MKRSSHPYRIRRFVTAFCPACARDAPEGALVDVPRLPGFLGEAEGRVWLVRGCPVHGRIVTLYEEEPAILDHLERWTARTREPTPDAPHDFTPLPGCYRHGLGAAQVQHTCTLLEDVGQQCNLRCPICFADSSPDRKGFAAIGDVLANVDQRLDREGGHLDVLMISGGEPTLHPDLTQLLAAAAERDITRILLNTNGLVLARDDDLLAFLRAHRDRIEVYLQYDGHEATTHRRLRGADLGPVKQRVVERLSGAEVFTTLTMTAALGVNDHEIGAVVRTALDTPFVGGVMIQPVFGSGRGEPIDPCRRLTHTGVLRRLDEQTDGRVTWHDLIALPCSHPHCASVGYLLRLDDGSWRSLVSLLGDDLLHANVDAFSNRILDPTVDVDLETLAGAAVGGLHTEGISLNNPTVGRLFASLLRRGDVGMSTLIRAAADARLHPHRLRRMVGERVKRLGVKPFMDLDTMIEERLMQCCVHVGTRDGRRHQAVPFCAAQAWLPLARSKVGV